MPTTFVIGKKGGGKSLRVMRMIEHELRKTKRTIVTNLPIRYERFREYLVEKYGQDFEYKERMLMIDREQVARFWLYFAVERAEFIELASLPEHERDRYKDDGGKWVTHPRKIQGQVRQFEADDQKKTEVMVPNFEERKGYRPVCYFLDEIHLTFNSRRWTRTGEHCGYYISLERHFGDDQVLATQNFGNVDKQLRDMGQEYLLCVNQKKMPIPGTFGMVRRPFNFTCMHYSDPPTSSQAQPISGPHLFALDKEGIASCYRTVAGAEFGVGDDKADSEVEARGKLPFWALIGIIAVVAVAGWFGVSHAATWVVGVGGASKEKPAAVVRPAQPGEVAKTHVAGETPGLAAGEKGSSFLGNKSEVPNHSRRKNSSEEVREQIIYCTGLAATGPGRMSIFLSNGRVLSNRERDFGGFLYDGLGKICGARFGGIEYWPAPNEQHRRTER